MSIIRPYSQASSNRSSSKPGFQTKLKARIPGLASNQDKINQSINLNKSLNDQHGFYSSRSISFNQSNPKIQNMENNNNNSLFNKTASQLTALNFNNHQSETCVCSQCNCGRHLCKFNNIKPDLTKKTIYNKDFLKKSAYAPKIIYAKQYEKLKGPHLGMNSTQRQSFIKKQGDKLERPVPQDLLKSEGPMNNLTTYKSVYPGYKGANQYIKPTDRHFRDNFPLRSQSTYTDQFKNREPKKDDYKYMSDMLKTGGNWYGKTTYGNFFQNPNPQYHAKKVKVQQKYNDVLGYSKQYETVYKNDFIPKQVKICPAKINLQTRAKGMFNSKSVFQQNTDFKAMSPEYQAFSTSKFGFA